VYVLIKMCTVLTYMHDQQLVFQIIVF